MNKYLFFRTDRIGDFIVTLILVNSIKRHDQNSKIIFIGSKKNYHFIKKIKLIDEVYLYPQSSLIGKIKLIKYLNDENLDYIFVTDGKKKSIVLSLFIKSQKKIFNVTKSIFKKIFKLSSIKVFYDDEETINKIDIIKKNLEYIKFRYKETDLDIFDIQNVINNIKINKDFVRNLNDFSLFHFDEKWIFNNYIRTYKNIEPTISQLENFISNIIKKTKMNLIISTGVSENSLINLLKGSMVRKFENLYIKNYDEYSLVLADKMDFFDIQYLILNSNILITCHGAPTHVASSFNIKILDIIDVSEKSLFEKYTFHLRNYNYLLREDFKNLSKEIIDFL
tara:strand:- start:103 stop:1113 length:1011 start_codon:yes stop_codon:yes gene_type:complete